MYTVFGRSSTHASNTHASNDRELTAMEELVARAVRARYAVLSSRPAQAAFLQGLGKAQAELEGLADQENVDYSLPRMGEAYALKYHMYLGLVSGKR